MLVDVNGERNIQAVNPYIDSFVAGTLIVANQVGLFNAVMAIHTPCGVYYSHTMDVVIPRSIIEICDSHKPWRPAKYRFIS